jgi:cell wall-associated NlpC family hydrolase
VIPVLTQELRSRIRSVAHSWLGTPFVPHGRVKGFGVDCVNLPAAVLVEAGVLSDVSTGAYAIDAGRHACDSHLAKWLREDGRFQELAIEPLPDLLEVDLLCFRIGRGVAHHLGLVTAPTGSFIHCLRGHGVIRSTLADPTYRRVLTHIFRPQWALELPTT